MHRLLERQLRKAFDGLVPDGLEPLLQLVSEAYESADQDRALLERAMDLAGDELADRNQELQARVEALEDARSKLSAADQWRKRFINSAAHELNTPITPMVLQLDAIGYMDPSSADWSRSMDLLRRNVSRLSMLVADLLDAAKVQSDHVIVRRENMDLAAVARDCIESHSMQALHRGIAMHASIDSAMTHGDDRRTHQVLTNLISNAIKFSPDGSDVRVEVKPNPPRVVVEDHGMGIDEAGLEILFRPFTRLHDTKDVKGTGLGLYVSRGIMEAMGGSLEAASDGPGKGARFVATFPEPHNA